MIALVLFGTAFATTYTKLTLAQQVEKADLIVRASIKQKNLETRAGKIWTVYTLEIAKTYKGTNDVLKDSSFAVFDSEKVKLEFAPQFNLKDDLFLMLYAKNYDSPVVGFNQAAYKIGSNGVTQLGGKPVILEQDGKKTEATVEAFAKQLEELTGGAK